MSNPSSVRSARGHLAPLLFRLHGYIGLFIGPFLVVAALSGVLYALTPQLEERLYAGELFTASRGPALPLARQIETARARIGEAARLAAVRPAPAPGFTTRVMFAQAGAGPSEHRALFVDPVSGEIRGDLPVYGTSGVLPLRTWIDRLHRSLLLGEWGRLYSELAASWLWVAAVGGLLLWLTRRGGAAPSGFAARWHRRLGLGLLLGLLFFSATGLTWSKWAGSRIGLLRAEFGWATPALSTALSASASAAGAHDEHAHHGTAPSAATLPAEPALFDAVLAAARAAGIDAGKVEIVPATAAGRAWTVSEIDRGWPTQVDAVAVDPVRLTVTDRVDFADYPLAAKLTRWGIDAHMGVLFGLANQLLLVGVGGGLLLMAGWGYRMWWRRRPGRGAAAGPWRTLRRLPGPMRLGILAGATVLGLCLPVMGASLLAFVLLDEFRVRSAARGERG